MSRCAPCHTLPKECTWGFGPYAGTMLLYLQEIAINRCVLLPGPALTRPDPAPVCRVLSQQEWEGLPGGLLDQGVTDTGRSVCGVALLHCM